VRTSKKIREREREGERERERGREKDAKEFDAVKKPPTTWCEQLN